MTLGGKQDQVYTPRIWLNSPFLEADDKIDTFVHSRDVSDTLSKMQIGLFFYFVFPYIRRLDPPDNALLSLDHKPFIATGALDYRCKNLSLVKLV